jgi:hypothetical protein
MARYNRFRPGVKASRWVILGSRLLRTFLGRVDVRAGNSLDGVSRAKAAPLQGAASGQSARPDRGLKRVAHAEIHLHEIVSGAVDDIIIGFAKYAHVRGEPVF